MKRIYLLLIITMLVFTLIACGQKPQPDLKGSYQSTAGKAEYVITLSFDLNDNVFFEYIDNRQVDTGTFEKMKGNTYQLKSERQDFEIVLNRDNIFEITLAKLNNGKPLQIKNVDDIPVSFGNQYNDIDKYKALLD